MADDRSNLMKSNENQDDSGQAQARRLDESVVMSKGCEPQDNMQRYATNKGMGHGNTMKDLLGNVVSPADDATKNPSLVGSNNGSGGGNNNNSNTYMYSNHSLI